MKRSTIVIVVSSVVILVSAVIAVIYGFFYLVGRSGKPPATTSSDAVPAEVSFLTLPENAESIRYWNHWHNRIVVFESSEADFISLFPSTTFSEIVEPKTYYIGGFGDTASPPWQQQVTAKASYGLLYERIAANGGGVTVLYDRNTGTVFYESAAW